MKLYVSLIRVFLLSFILFLTACGSNGSQHQPGQEELPEDFSRFYLRFHEDSVFQMNHILFPLRGLPVVESQSQEEIESFKWEADQWVLHKAFDSGEGTDFEVEFQQIDSSLIIETIIQKSTNFGMSRRYARMGDGWMLIYYAAMNPVGQ